MFSLAHNQANLDVTIVSLPQFWRTWSLWSQNAQNGTHPHPPSLPAPPPARARPNPPTSGGVTSGVSAPQRPAGAPYAIPSQAINASSGAGQGRVIGQGGHGQNHHALPRMGTWPNQSRPANGPNPINGRPAPNHALGPQKFNRKQDLIPHLSRSLSQRVGMQCCSVLSRRIPWTS